MTQINVDIDDDRLAELAPTISFPHDRADSKMITLMLRKNFNMDSLTKDAIILRYLGGQEYYNQISKWLHVAHSTCPAKRMTVLLDKIDLLKYFSGDNMEQVVTRRVAEKTDEEKNDEEVVEYDVVQWNKRVIGRGSDYIELLKNQQSDYFENDQLNRSEKRNKEKQLSKSIHLIILEFLKIWKVEHDEILYVDHDESITNYMKKIHLCKVLKVNTHQVGSIKLEQQQKAQKGKEAVSPPQATELYEHVSASSQQGNHGDQVGYDEQDIAHPVMNHEVIHLINTLMP